MVLLLAVVLHIWSAWSLTLQSRRARPVRYQNQELLQSSYAVRTMRWGGFILLLFVLYHLAHLTLGWAHPDFTAGKVYQNVVVGFQVGWVAAFYIVANLALGFHLYHGLWSFFQTLGFNQPAWNPWRRRFATLFALVVTLGADACGLHRDHARRRARGGGGDLHDLDDVVVHYVSGVTTMEFSGTSEREVVCPSLREWLNSTSVMSIRSLSGRPCVSIIRSSRTFAMVFTA